MIPNDFDTVDTNEEESEMRLMELQEKLMDASTLDGTEAGEYWGMLYEMSNYVYCMPDEFKEAFLKEIKSQVESIQNDYELVEEERTEKYKVKHLKYRG